MTVNEIIRNNDMCVSKLRDIDSDVLELGKDLYSVVASYLYNTDYSRCLEYDLDTMSKSAEGKSRRTVAKKLMLGNYSISEIKENFDKDVEERLVKAFPWTSPYDLEDAFDCSDNDLSRENAIVNAHEFLILMFGYVRMRYMLKRYDDKLKGSSEEN